MSKTLPALTAAAALDGSEQTLVSQGGNPRRALLGAARANDDGLNLLNYIPQTEWAGIRNWTSTYDCLAAMNAAIADLFHLNVALGGGVAGGKIGIPPGHYLFSGTINLNEVYVYLQGAGCGEAGGPATVLVWTADVPGIHVYHDAVSGGSGSGSRFDGLALYGKKSGGNSSGIDAGERVTITNCTVNGFSGNGINLVASVPGGNCNNWYVEKARLFSNGGHGMLVYGTDVNAGTGISISASFSGGFGIYDASFLGNTYVGLHTEANTAGAYKDDSPDARNLWLGCYSESGQPASNFQGGQSQVIGGLHAAGFTSDTTAVLRTDQSTPFVVNRTTGLGSVAGLTFIYGQTGAAIIFQDNAGGNNILGLYDSNSGCWADCGDYSPQYNSLLRTSNNNVITDADTGVAIGHGATIYPSERYVRNTTGTAKFTRVTYASAAPTGATPTGQAWSLGDIVYNTAPAAGGFVGWVCTTAGVVGSGGVFKTFGPISA